MAPLYNTVPVTRYEEEPGECRCEHKLDENMVTTDTLKLIRYVNTLFGDKWQHKGSEKQELRAMTKWFSALLSLATLAALAVTSLVLWRQGLERHSDCMRAYGTCSTVLRHTTAAERTAELEKVGLEAGACAAVVIEGDLQHDLEEVCTLMTTEHLWGMAIWRWLLLFGLLWPCKVFGSLVTRSAALLVHVNITGDIVPFVIFGIQSQVSCLIRSCTWFGAWFAISAHARNWAQKSHSWNNAAKREIWPSDFAQVHQIVWRILLLLVIKDALGLCAAIFGRVLSLQFHHAKHFERMRTALMTEHIVQALAQPWHVKRHVKLLSGDIVMTLVGFECAHWEALLFVTRVATQHGSALEFDVCQEAHRVQREIARTIAYSVLKSQRKRGLRLRVLDPPEAAHQHSRQGPHTTLWVEDSSASQKQLVSHRVDALTNNIILQAEHHAHRPVSVEHVDDSESDTTTETNSSCTASADAEASSAANDEGARSTCAHAVAKFMKKFVSSIGIVAPAVTLCRPRADDLTGHRKAGNIYQLHKYLTSSANIHVFAGQQPDNKDRECMNAISTADAWKLGYYVFWNIRSPANRRCMLSRQDINRVLRLPGLPNKLLTKRLLDRNNDSWVTMDEIIESMVGVFKARKDLAHAMSDCNNVVGQVQRIVYTVLLVVLTFIALGMLIPGGFSKIWAATSAALLSVSFVFGNSIREAFENCIFLLVTHPFDQGDAVRMDGEQYTVQEVNLHHVRMASTTGSTVNIRAHDLISARITNLTRSDNVWDAIHFEVDIGVSIDQCEQIADRVVSTLAKHSPLYGGRYRFWVADAGMMNKLRMSLWFDHNTCGADLLRMGEARTRLAVALGTGLQEAGITYTEPHLPGSYAARHTPA